MAGYNAQIGATYREILTAIAGRLAAVIEAGQGRRLHPAVTIGGESDDGELAETLTQIVWAALYLEAP